jgi:isopentenyl diphosphate isomerase/L-lactate dehydrogenase-like FMN-dependent dehydrogenase
MQELSKLYMNRDRSVSEALIKRIEREGFKAIMLTVDAAVPGKRELDRRTKGDLLVSDILNGLIFELTRIKVSFPRANMQD